MNESKQPYPVSSGSKLWLTKEEIHRLDRAAPEEKGGEKRDEVKGLPTAYCP